MGSTSLQPARCQGQHHTFNRYKCPPGFAPSFCPTCWHCSCMFHIPPALQMTYSLLGPSLVPAGAELVFTNHHKTPSALAELKLQHGDV